MKYTLQTLIIALSLLIPATCFGTGTDSFEKQKSYFLTAKQELENMLDGKQPLSYERAIYLIENAYWANKLNYAHFTSGLNNHETIIRRIMEVNAPRIAQKYEPQILERAIQTPEDRSRALENLLANWAIYAYMKDTISYLYKDSTWDKLFSYPYVYSYSDPLGTTHWENTQISNLLITGRGNCFALASLYKIFAERLHTNATLSTAPNHIYIVNQDEKGREYNVELSNGSFPGSGTMGTLTYTTNTAIDNDIALRQLDLKQSVALCIVYLAKGYEHKFGTVNDGFMMACAESTLRHDSKSLNAMLLKAELLENEVLAKQQNVTKLQADRTFAAYEKLITQLYTLGYREMPVDMKNKLIKGWTRDSSTILASKNYNPPAYNHAGQPNTRYASLSWGAFDEEIPNKPIEQFGCTVYDTKAKK